MSVITISRQFGAAGKTFGRQLADTLGHYYVDEDIIERAVVELPLSDKERYIDGFKYVELLNLIIPKIAKDGNAVIVGRGGQYILHTFAETYHLLLIANEEDRINFIEENYRVSRTKAVQMIKRMDKRRANLFSYFRRKDYDDPTIYNLVLNMSLVSIEKAQDLVYKLING